MELDESPQKVTGSKPEVPHDRSAWFAGGGLRGALFASACCVLPLALFTLGVGGAWMGTLRALEAYQPLSAAVALAFIGAGFWSLRRKRRACTVDGYCATATAGRVTWIALWAATALVLLSLAWPWVFPFFVGR
ncbi:MAG: mercury transporter MerT [Ectothiorhodospiraceae bacterium]|nr:mercury transporter MerT [Ectothiorhodospiraceae bacterium]